jgi:hypothetical protein
VLRKQIQSSDDAFAALLEDGRVVSWGDRYFNERIAGAMPRCAPKLEEITGKSWEIYRQIHYK